MSADRVSVNLDVGGSETLIALEKGEATMLVALPHGSDVQDVEDLLEAADVELAHTARVVPGSGHG